MLLVHERQSTSPARGAAGHPSWQCPAHEHTTLALPCHRGPRRLRRLAADAARPQRRASPTPRRQVSRPRRPPPASGRDAVLPLWPEVKKGTLANGLTYYILQHGKPEKRALLWLAVNAGSVLEDDDQRGLAHFDEHMAFNGTKRFPKDDDRQLPREDRHAVRRRPQRVHQLRRDRLPARGADRQARVRRQGPRHPARLGRRRHATTRPRSRRSAAWCSRSGGSAAARRRGCSTSTPRCCSRARATRIASRSACRRSLKKAPRDALVPVLQGLVPPRPDGGDRGR